MGLPPTLDQFPGGRRAPTTKPPLPAAYRFWHGHIVAQSRPELPHIYVLAHLNLLLAAHRGDTLLCLSKGSEVAHFLESCRADLTGVIRR